MVLGRAISAAFGTATIPLVYAIGARLSGRAAGLLAAALLACAVIHLRESHFFSVDVSMTFFTVLAWLFSLRLAEHGRMRDAVAAGLAFGGAILCKYSGGFVVLVIAAAYVLSPRRPARGQPAGSWIRWAAAGLVPFVAGALLFLALDPMMWLYFDKFKDDLRSIVIEPLTGASRPIWTAQFADIGSPALYWLTNILWFSLGPAFEIWSLIGVVWLATRRRKLAFLAVCCSRSRITSRRAAPSRRSFATQCRSRRPWRLPPRSSALISSIARGSADSRRSLPRSSSARPRCTQSPT